MGLRDDVKKQWAAATEKQRETAAKNAEGRRQKDDELLRQAGLHLSEYNDGAIEDLNAQSLRRIVGEGGWASYWSLGTMLSNAADKVQISLQKIQVEQNFILIRQNEQIIRLLSDRRSAEISSAGNTE